ncbi:MULTISPECIES: nucleotidyltransferase domain-containing protein [Streptomyces]|uniref:Nucleotidyltransferase domain-containing protein n=2 Tax=Streptomyces TaxID=1883 RepID=A0ABW9J036_STRGJ
MPDGVTSGHRRKPERAGRCTAAGTSSPPTADEEIDSIVGCIVQVARPERVVMFGSHAKGRATVKSDLDLLIVMPTDAPALVRASEVEAYLGGWAVPVDLHFVTVEQLEEYGREEHHFLHSVLRSGNTLYERDR